MTMDEYDDKYVQLQYKLVLHDCASDAKDTAEARADDVAF